MAKTVSLIILSLASLGFGPQLATATQWAAYGDLRGHVEPCGCSPETDLGGIARIGAVTTSWRQKYRDFILLSLGNNLPEAGESLKTETMLRFEAKIKPNAILFNTIDKRRSDTISAFLGGAPAGKLPYVLSVKDRPAFVHYSLQVGSVQIFAYVAAKGGKAPVSNWQQHIKGKGRAWLLLGGDREALTDLQQTGLFEKIILANQTPMGREPSLEEKNQPGLLFHDGAYMVPGFGQGVLVSPTLAKSPTFSVTPSLGQQSQTMISAPTGSPSLSFAAQGPFVWLDRRYKGASALDEVLDFYEKGASEHFVLEADRRAKDLDQSPFAGAKACASCHADAYTIWQKSRHASAHHTLKAKERHQDAHCISCHVVGYDEKGGFVDLARSPYLKDVQCENCHGAAKAHSLNPSVKPAIASPEATCKGCHKIPHTATFDFKAYWPKIRH